MSTTDRRGEQHILVLGWVSWEWRCSAPCLIVSGTLRPTPCQCSAPVDRSARRSGRNIKWPSCTSLTWPSNSVTWSMPRLADVFARFDSVVNCVGVAEGQESRPSSHAPSWLPGEPLCARQFGVDYDAVGRGSP